MVYTLLSGPMVYTPFPSFSQEKLVYTIAFFALWPRGRATDRERRGGTVVVYTLFFPHTSQGMDMGLRSSGWSRGGVAWWSLGSSMHPWHMDLTHSFQFHKGGASNQSAHMRKHLRGKPAFLFASPFLSFLGSKKPREKTHNTFLHGIFPGVSAYFAYVSFSPPEGMTPPKHINQNFCCAKNSYVREKCSYAKKKMSEANYIFWANFVKKGRID